MKSYVTHLGRTFDHCRCYCIQQRPSKHLGFFWSFGSQTLIKHCQVSKHLNQTGWTYWTHHDFQSRQGTTTAPSHRDLAGSSELKSTAEMRKERPESKNWFVLEHNHQISAWGVICWWSFCWLQWLVSIHVIYPLDFRDLSVSSNQTSHLCSRKDFGSLCNGIWLFFFLRKFAYEPQWNFIACSHHQHEAWPRHKALEREH